MSRKKSEAVIKSARFNPINQMEKDALDIIAEREGQGLSFKQIVVDAILFSDDRTPEMYPDNTQVVSVQILSQLDQMFSRFAHEILSQVKRGGIQTVEEEPDAEDSEGRPSKFAKSLAKSFIERQRRAMGDE